MHSAHRERLALSALTGAVKSWFVGGTAAAPGMAPNEADGLARRELRVLVVDDNPVNLAIVSALLERHGITPQLAADGVEAVELACATAYDIILMDLQLPRLNGLEATERIRHFESMHSRTHAPVVAYSSVMVDGAVLRTNGLNGVLAKPCSSQQLDDCMARWCSRWSCPGDQPSKHGSSDSDLPADAIRHSARE